MDAAAISNKSKSQVLEFRNTLLDELPLLARQYIDTARAEATTAAYEKVMNTALKVIEGLEVEKAKDKYANLPTINFILGADMQITTTVDAPAPTPVPKSPDVTDVTPKDPLNPEESASLPHDPLELLHGHEEPDALPSQDAQAEQRRQEETLLTLELAGSALAMD